MYQNSAFLPDFIHVSSNSMNYWVLKVQKIKKLNAVNSLQWKNFWASKQWYHKNVAAHPVTLGFFKKKYKKMSVYLV